MAFDGTILQSFLIILLLFLSLLLVLFSFFRLQSDLVICNWPTGPKTKQTVLWANEKHTRTNGRNKYQKRATLDQNFLFLVVPISPVLFQFSWLCPCPCPCPCMSVYWCSAFLIKTEHDKAFKKIIIITKQRWLLSS